MNDTERTRLAGPEELRYTSNTSLSGSVTIVHSSFTFVHVMIVYVQVTAMYKYSKVNMLVLIYT